MSTQADQQVSIRGSWESLLEEAERHAGNFNDEAIPIFEKIVTRLGKMPKTQRMAANQRLQNIWMQAAVDLHSFLAMRERYDESLALIEQIKDEIPFDQRDLWDMHAAMLQLQAGRDDAAIARIRALAEREESDLQIWGELASVLMRLKRFDEAVEILDRMDDWIAERYAVDEPDESAAQRRDRGYILSLRSMEAVETDRPDEGVKLLDQSIALDNEFRSRLPMTYIRLIRHRDYARALSLIRRDQETPIRARFWEAVIHARQGEQSDAEAIWRKITKDELTDDDAVAVMEYILSLYYLGDPGGRGLSNMLSVLNEDSSQFWAVYLLAGIGWAIRGNVANARSDFETAMLQRRAGGEGRLLPYESWSYLLDLLDEDQRTKYSHYFETDPDA